MPAPSPELSPSDESLPVPSSELSPSDESLPAPSPELSPFDGLSQFSPTTTFVGVDTLPSLSFSTTVITSPLSRSTPSGISTVQLPSLSMLPSEVLPSGNVTTIVLPGVPSVPVTSVSLSSTGLTVGAGISITSPTVIVVDTSSVEPSGYVTVTGITIDVPGTASSEGFTVNSPVLWSTVTSQSEGTFDLSISY